MNGGVEESTRQRSTDLPRHRDPIQKKKRLDESDNSESEDAQKHAMKNRQEATFVPEMITVTDFSSEFFFTDVVW